MNSIRLRAGILAGHLSATAIHALGLGSATSMPGHIASVLAPELLAYLGRRLPHGSVLVTGTNGKSTTVHLLTDMVARAGLRPVRNHARENLRTELTTALLARSTIDGRVRADIGLFEVDETILPRVIEPLGPRVIVLGNLFRGPLDSHEEVDRTAAMWRDALRRIGHTTVIYNADDPLVADLGREVAGAWSFGVDDGRLGRGGGPEHAADARYCHRCGAAYQYATVYFGHLGTYCCRQCGASRPPLTVAAREVTLHGLDGVSFTLSAAGATVGVVTPLPGLYNVYNVLAGAGAARALGIHPEVIAAAAAAITPAFGQGKPFAIDGHPVVALLVQNPAGLNEVLRTLISEGRPLVAVLAFSEGRDFSWLWDVDFELLRGPCRRAVLTGQRAAEVALRLKYAGLDGETVTIESDEARAIDLGLSRVLPGEPLFLLATSGALRLLRGILTRRGMRRRKSPGSRTGPDDHI